MANQLLLEEVIADRLKNNSAVSADLGSGANCRVYPLVFPQSVVYPAVFYERSTSKYEHNMAGDSSFNTGTLAITVAAQTFLKCRNVAGNIRLALSGLRGTYTVGAKSLLVQRLLIGDDKDEFVALEGKEYGLWINESHYEYTIRLETPTLD